MSHTFSRRCLVRGLPIALLLAAAGSSSAGHRGCSDSGSGFSFRISLGSGYSSCWPSSGYRYGYSRYRGYDDCGTTWRWRGSDCRPSYSYGRWDDFCYTPRTYCPPRSTIIVSGADCAWPSRSSFVYGGSYDSAWHYGRVRTYVNADARARQAREEYYEWQRLQERVEELERQAEVTRETGTYVPGEPEPSPAPLAMSKGRPSGDAGNIIKPDRPRGDGGEVTESALDAAFERLASGDAEAALRDFASAASTEGNARAKIGYALAAAELGRYEAAGWSMRRALALGGDPLGYLVLPEGMSARLDAVSARIRKEAGRAGSNIPGAEADLWLLAAAVDFLREDRAGAREAIEKSVAAAGAEDVSTRHMRELLGPDAR